MTEKEERAYVEGSNAAWMQVLHAACKNLGHETTPDGGHVLHLAETRAALRTLCDEVGASNAWPDDLHLADVVNKYVLPHLLELKEKIKDLRRDLEMSNVRKS